MTTEKITAYKGFDKNFKCRDFQYAVGQTYEHDGEVKASSSGFHACENPLDIFNFYAPADSVFAVVELSGEISRETDGYSKIAAGSIHIKAELTIPQIVAKAIEWVTVLCKPGGDRATGDRSASSALGYRSASSATGDRSASSATRDRSASSASGIGAVALNTGRQGKARANEGGAIVLCVHDDDGNLLHIRASKVGENGIKEGVYYTLTTFGEFVEAA